MCSLVVSDLRSKKKVPGSSSAASYVQGELIAVIARVMSAKRVEMAEKS